MLVSLKVKNSFHKENLYIKFDKGLNVIVGPNGYGKSHTLECINFALFGSTALRSSVSDHPDKFTVELVFVIGEDTYTVQRTLKTSKILQDKKTIVTGTTPCNNFIKELLGFDYKVFSLTNYIQQHGLLTLTSLNSTALSNLVETVSGIEDSYALEKYLKEQLSYLRSEKKTLQITRDNTKIEDLNFSFNKELDDYLEEDPNYIDTIDQKINQYERDIRNLEASTKIVSNLYDNYKENTISIEELESFSNINVSELTDMLVELQKHTSRLEFLKDSIKDIVEPEEEYSTEYLESQIDLHYATKEYESYLTLKKSIEASMVECPSCNHKFHPGSRQIEERDPPEAPVLSREVIKTSQQWNSTKEAYKSSVSEIDSLEETLKNLPQPDTIKNQIDKYNKYIKAKESLDGTLTRLREAVTNINPKYRISGEKYKSTTKLLEYIPVLLASVKPISQEIAHKVSEQKSLQRTLISYESDKKAYLVLYDTVSKIDLLIETNNKKYQITDLLLKTLIESKKEIQSQSLPMISTLASRLINRITNGQRSRISLSNSFEILLDNNPVELAEGSAQAIVNIVLRIALLDTFYKDNFLVFLGDEVDSSLHEDRFALLERVFDNLSQQGYQIILVSHREFTTGNIIDLHGINQ